MRSPVLLAAALALALAGAPGAVGATNQASTGSCPAHAGVAAVPGRALPVVRDLRYRLGGRIKLLLFWVGRDRVGTGRLVWRSDSDAAAAYELLIGTDPALTPRRLNRWGYIAEERRGDATRVFGVMTTSEEAEIKDFRGASPDGGPGGRFKALRSTVSNRESCSATATFETERDLTLRDVAELEGQAGARLDTVQAQPLPTGPDIRPGFLSAVAELVDAVRPNGRPGTLKHPQSRSLRFVYGRKLYGLALLDVEDLTPSGRSTADLVRARFEIRAPTGDRERFGLDFATRGPLAGVPVVIRYQPRWWLQATLTMEDGGGPGGEDAGR
jgi:hypothetical protein